MPTVRTTPLHRAARAAATLLLAGCAAARPAVDPGFRLER